MTPTPAHPDARFSQAPKGRGAAINPPNRFETVALRVLPEELERQTTEADGQPPRVATTVLEDESRSVINKVDSPDLPFSWTLNPYRGCEHGCIYCYARPGHEYLGMSCGIDFETRIMAKPRAPQLLRSHLGKKSWTGEPIVMSGVTDPYQPAEREQGITRRCLEVMLEHRQPVSIITKNRMVMRDLDLLKQFAAWKGVRVAISLTTLDVELARIMEPRASSPKERLRAIEELTAAGVDVTVMTAPMIPAINDMEMPALLEAAASAGAKHAGFVVLRLPHQIKDLFLEWLTRHFPDRAGKVESLVRQMRGGDLNVSKFGERMKGTGAWAEQMRATFKVFCRRHGLNTERMKLNSGEFRRPEKGGQMGLWG